MPNNEVVSNEIVQQSPIASQNEMSELQEAEKLFQQNQNPQQMNQQQQAPPEDAISMAHMLIQDPALDNKMTGRKKDMILGNLSTTDIFRIEQGMSLHDDLTFLLSQQSIRNQKITKEHATRKGYSEADIALTAGKNLDLSTGQITTIEQNTLFDKAGIFISSAQIAILSRGKGGFERNSQISTISNASLTKTDKTEELPGFINKIKNSFGGFKKN